MRSVVVYDSMFGNTDLVARAVVDGLAAYGPAEVLSLRDAPSHLDGVDLLVVGGPTHGHGLSNATSRHVSATQAAAGALAGSIGLREWLAGLDASPGTPAATFDTRFRKPTWLTGSAARSAAKHLRASGFRLVGEPESFFVAATEGPLAEGELDRARRWGRTLGGLAQAATST
jgi:hypothetical protein